VPVRYFPEASSASLTQSIVYGLKILWLLSKFVLFKSGVVRGRQFESLKARYRQSQSAA
jgi:hypothetical protein